jgi:hypothetical protein
MARTTTKTSSTTTRSGSTGKKKKDTSNTTQATAKTQSRKSSSTGTRTSAQKGNTPASTAKRSSRPATNGARKSRTTNQSLTWTEEIGIAGNQLVDKFKELITEGNVQRVIVKNDGNVLLEIPLTVALVGGALAVWAAPVITAVTAIAGVVSQVTIEVERTGKATSKSRTRK